MSNIQQLYQLQQIDSKTDAAMRRLKIINGNLVETDAYKRAKTTLATAEKSLSICRTNTTDIDLDVKHLQQKIAKNENRLYGGKVTNPKEAASLQEEVASTKRWLAKREEDLLEAMIQQEEAQSELQQRNVEFTAVKEKWESDQSDLLHEQNTLETEVAALADQRNKIEPHIDASDKKIYESLRAKKGGVAVSGVNDGNCLSCGVMLSHRIVQQAEDDSTITTCENCGRILFSL